MSEVPLRFLRMANVTAPSRLKDHIGGIAFGPHCGGRCLKRGKQPEVKAPFLCVGRLVAKRYQSLDNKTAAASEKRIERALLGPVLLGFGLRQGDSYSRIAQRFLGDSDFALGYATVMRCVAPPAPRPRSGMGNSGCAGQAAARQVNPNKRTPELEQTYLAIRYPLDNVFAYSVTVLRSSAANAAADCAVSAE